MLKIPLEDIMSTEKVKVPLMGKKVDGVDVNFKVKKEEWNEYELEDGTILKFKSVVTKIVRTEEYNEQNEPIYYINSQNVASAKIPDKLKKRAT